MLCKECGTKLSKGEKNLCEICAGNKEWERREKSRFALPIFSRRMYKNLNQLNILPEEEYIEEIQKEGNGLFLYGATGSGKTLYAGAIMMELLRRSCVYRTPFFKMEIITAINLLEKIRASFNFSAKKEEEEEVPKKTTEEILKHYDSIDLLVLDDLGAESPTVWSLQIMQMIINNRYEKMLPTIITSNLGLQELAEQLDDRIASRIYEMCTLVYFGEEDHRLQEEK